MVKKSKAKSSAMAVAWTDYGARMHDQQIGIFFVIDEFAEKYSVLSPYNYVANNPILNIDVNGDSIFITNNLIAEPVMRDAITIMNRTQAGRQEYNSYWGSRTHDVYIGKSDIGSALMGTKAEVNEKGLVQNNKFTDNDPKMKGLNGLNVSKSNGKTISVMVVDNTGLKESDKYELAFALFHEFKAHITYTQGNSDKEHGKFGNTLAPPGLGLKGSDGVMKVKFGTDAWKMLKELIQLKINDGNGTEQNKKDIEIMRKMEEDEKKKRTN